MAIAEKNTLYQSFDPTLSDAIELWNKRIEITRKGGTIVKYDYLIRRHILPELGAVKLSEINTNLLNDFIYRKSVSGRIDSGGTLSPSYVRSIAIVLRSVISFAIDERMCLPFELKTIKPPIEKKAIVVLSHNEQRQLEKVLLENMDVTKLGIYISLFSGLRIGEICALTWNNIDLDEGILRVDATVSRVMLTDLGKKRTTLIIDKPKTPSSVRDIPICSSLRKILERMKKSASSAYVISERESFISPRTYEYRYHRLLKENGLRSVNYHVLRHTFATRCMEVGMDIKSLSEILGHSNVSTTMDIYIHSSIEHKRKQMEKLSRFF